MFILRLLCLVLFMPNHLITANEKYSECVIPKVKCTDGTMFGKIMKTRNNRDIFAYMGIPYALPPIGNLRFRPPVPHGPWGDVLNATIIHPSCPQRDIYRRSHTFEGEEDCLYLNVYTPKSPSNKNETLLPVMVFFHGGGWLCGGGNQHWYGPDVMLDRDVVLVVTNYRLGALGFLSTGDEVVPGNNGLKDQNLALRWVQRNIKYFGGDPKSVTIFGESAGGASVHYHMLSPKSKGLFHKAISMSGTSLCVWAAAPENECVLNSKKLADSLDCPIDSSESMVDCLRNIDALEIVKHDVVFMEWDFDPMIPFKPTVEPDHEGAFLTKSPIDIITSGQSAPVPLIVGITSEDGALRAAAILNNDNLLNELNRDFDRLAPISLMYDKTVKNISEVTRQLKKFYFGNGELNWNKKEEVIDLYTDGWFMNCADKTIRLHKKHSNQPVYYYLFAHRGTSSFTKIFGGGDQDYGVSHADDLQYLFPVGDGLFPDKKATADDIFVAKLFTTLFSNFAATGNPTPIITDVVSESWDPVSSDQIQYYHIDARSPGMRQGLYSDRAELWRKLDTIQRTNDLNIFKDEL